MEATVTQESKRTPPGETPPAILLAPLPPESFAAPLPSQILSHTSQCHFLSYLTLKAAASSAVSPTQIALGHIKDWIQKHIPTFADGATETDSQCNTLALRFRDAQLSTLRHEGCGTTPDSAPLRAFALEHTDTNFSGRRWRTEIVLHELPDGSAKVFIGVYHGLRREYVGAPLAKPDASTPTVVGSLLSDGKVECLYDGIRTFGSPLAIDDSRECGERFLNLLLHSTRTTPLVLINRNTAEHGGEYRWNPREMTKACLGSGTIVVARTALDVSGPFLSTVAQGLGEQGYRYIAGICRGGVRVYQPRPDLNNQFDSTRHRYFRPADGQDVPRWIQEGLRNTLRASLDNTHEVFTFEGVLQAIRQAAELKRLDELEERTKQALAATADNLFDKKLTEVMTLVADLQQELQEQQRASVELATVKDQLARQTEETATAESLLGSATKQIQDLQGELDEEKATRHTAEHRANSFRQLLEDRDSAIEAGQELKIPLDLPTTPHEAVSFLREALKPRVVVLDNAVESSSELPNSRTIDTWNCLVKLHQTLWPLHFNETEEGARAVDSNKIPATFYQETGIDYAVKESSMTNKDRDLKRLRQVEVDGEIFDFSPHLKVGHKPSDLLRIHIAVDQNRKRILVWHCGGHLETAGTRRM
jgi:hypothetical protein